MSDVLLLISLALFILFLLALISPKRFLPGANPKRGMALAIYLLPSLICFIALGAVYTPKVEAYLENRETVHIDLSSEGLSELPAEYSQFNLLEILNLSDNFFDQIPPMVGDYERLAQLNLAHNNITALPSNLQNLRYLKVLDLSANPIQEIPAWLADLPLLDSLLIQNTDIAEIPLPLREATTSGKLVINYQSTPLYLAENPKPQEQSTELADASTDNDDEAERIENEDHTESFGEFAMRELFGRDLGHKRKFADCEVYYDDPTTKAMADTVGYFLTRVGLFTEDNEASVQFMYDDKAQQYHLKMVTVYHQADEVEEDILATCSFYSIMLSAKLPNELPVYWHLCDDDLEVLATTSSEME